MRKSSVLLLAWVILTLAMTHVVGHTKTTATTTVTTTTTDTVGAAEKTVDELVVEFLKSYEHEALRRLNLASQASWNMETNITDYNSQFERNVSLENAIFYQRMHDNAITFNLSQISNSSLARQISAIGQLGEAALTDMTKYNRLKEIESEMLAIHSTTKVYFNGRGYMDLDPDMSQVMAESTDYDRLTAVWLGWREAVGPRVKPLFTEYVTLLNEAYRMAGYTDAGEAWRSSYESESFEADVANLFAQVRPLYEQLHAHVRRRLKVIYGEDKFPASGHIPAQLLGEMWARHWDPIMARVKPFEKVTSPDITGEMLAQNYTVDKIFHLAESFFSSIGLKNMTGTFWNKSELVKPADGRKFVCHGSAWDFSQADDYRIKMCTDINKADLVTAHHEMGHIEYYMHYSNQPSTFRHGANPGFHEAVGDLISLSVQTPSYLHQIGLLPHDVTSTEADINFLLEMALQKVAFLPFGYIIDLWRWSIFRNDTSPENYNRDWWNLKCRYQGLSPPVPRSEADFDPGAKYHVAANTAYIRYFVSVVIQFQFHKAACQAAGHTGPLHRCNIYGSKDAGDRIRAMLEMGSSKKWPEAMRAITGQDKMDASALIEYFQPLLEFLEKENGDDYGWDPHCPTPLPKYLNTNVTFNDTEITAVLSFLEAHTTQARVSNCDRDGAFWAFRDDMTDDNKNIWVSSEIKLGQFYRQQAEQAKQFNTSVMPYDITRQLHLVVSRDTQRDLNNITYTQLQEVKANLLYTYLNVKVCLADSQCWGLGSDVSDIRDLDLPQDYNQRLDVWTAWHDVTGRKIKQDYLQYTQLARESGSSVADFWNSAYESSSFEADFEQLLEQVTPLYVQLQAYTLQELRGVYRGDNLPETGHIPAHLIGDLWDENWVKVIKSQEKAGQPDLSTDVTSKDRTPATLLQPYLDHLSSLGLIEVGSTLTDFLIQSNISKCSATTQNFVTSALSRLNQSESLTDEKLLETYNQMGEILYSMYARDQPYLYRQEALPGMGRAIGDVIALSLSNRQRYGNTMAEWNQTRDFQPLLDLALRKVPEIVSSFVQDKWRWSVARGGQDLPEINRLWWDLRCRYQGLSPPVPRSTMNLDAASKYHVISDLPATRHLVAVVAQFQIFKAACQISGHQGQLHTCHFDGSLEVGNKLKKMLQLGNSRPWPDILEMMTGSRTLDAGPLLEFFQPLYASLQLQNGFSFGWTPSCPKMDERFNLARDFNETEIDMAEKFLARYNEESLLIKNAAMLATWEYETNITSENEERKLNASLRRTEFAQRMAEEAANFNLSRMTYDLKRQLSSIAGSTAQPNVTKITRVNHLKSQMEKIYSEAKACLSKDRCLDLEPDLSVLMAESRDYEELLRAWQGWRDATGPKMKDMYAEFVELQTEAVKLQGRKDIGESWRAVYESPTFEEDIAATFAQVRPLYEQLHAYVRRKLKKVYGADRFPASGHIPAHILGDMWAQKWSDVYSIVTPYPDKTSPDITKEMKNQNYTVERMFRLAENFFVSLGFDKMTEKFWNFSQVQKPQDGRGFVCQGTAFDMFSRDDFRIKMCTSIRHKDLITVHHEMGHVQYYMQYQNQPVLYRSGANDGFHEAVGDVMALSVQTPEHLVLIKLLDKLSNDTEADINFLMSMALNRVAFLPFGYLIDMWRWSVFRGDTKPEHYNRDWWNLRCRYQGIFSPVERKSTDFDPGAKFHVPYNVPYMRYFISFVIQFQFHKAACQAAGYKGPLHRCDIYGSKEAGAKIRKMLSLGASRPWPYAMETLTGQSKIDVAPLLEYFQPLLAYLRKENGNDYGWDPACPTLTPAPNTPAPTHVKKDNGAPRHRVSILALYAVFFVVVFMCTSR